VRPSQTLVGLIALVILKPAFGGFIATGCTAGTVAVVEFEGTFSFWQLIAISVISIKQV
jgi:hypothetical protein